MVPELLRLSAASAICALAFRHIALGAVAKKQEPALLFLNLFLLQPQLILLMLLKCMGRVHVIAQEWKVPCKIKGFRLKLLY